MKITIEKRPESTLEEFADRHNLTMKVVQRKAGDYYAQFEGAWVKEPPSLLAGAYGDGATPEEAIKNYIPYISQKTLVFDDGKPTRREIDVPFLVEAVIQILAK